MIPELLAWSVFSGALLPMVGRPLPSRFHPTLAAALRCLWLLPSLCLLVFFVEIGGRKGGALACLAYLRATLLTAMISSLLLDRRDVSQNSEESSKGASVAGAEDASRKAAHYAIISLLLSISVIAMGAEVLERFPVTPPFPLVVNDMNTNGAFWKTDVNGRFTSASILQSTDYDWIAYVWNYPGVYHETNHKYYAASVESSGNAQEGCFLNQWKMSFAPGCLMNLDSFGLDCPGICIQEVISK